MAEARTQRRLAAILAADVVGYSRMMEPMRLEPSRRSNPGTKISFNR
jgi:hypothetical protein